MGRFSRAHLLEPRLSIGAPLQRRESLIFRHWELDTSKGVRLSVTESHCRKSRYTDFDIRHILQVCPMNRCRTGRVVITLYITGVGDPGLTRCLQSSSSNLTKPFLAAWLQSQTVVSKALTAPSVITASRIRILKETKEKKYIHQ